MKKKKQANKKHHGLTVQDGNSVAHYYSIPRSTHPPACHLADLPGRAPRAVRQPGAPLQLRLLLLPRVHGAAARLVQLRVRRGGRLLLLTGEGGSWDFPEKKEKKRKIAWLAEGIRKRSQEKKGVFHLRERSCFFFFFVLL